MLKKGCFCIEFRRFCGVFYFLGFTAIRGLRERYSGSEKSGSVGSAGDDEKSIDEGEAMADHPEPKQPFPLPGNNPLEATADASRFSGENNSLIQFAPSVIFFSNRYDLRKHVPP